MLVSHRKQFIFIKSAKTAGTSIEEYFEPWCLPEGAYVPQHGRPAAVTAQGVVGARNRKYHDTADGFISHLQADGVRARVGEEIWRRYFKFTCVRNPFDKVVSWFHMQVPREERAALADLEFARVREMFRNWLIIFPNTPNDQGYAAIDDEIVVDGLIRYERLMDDLEAACRRIGVPFEPDRMPQRKVGMRSGFPGYRDYYTAETRQVVADRFAWEFAHFDYDPDNP